MPLRGQRLRREEFGRRYGMKTNIVRFAACLLASGWAWADEIIPSNQLPDAVQKSIEATRAGERVKEVTRRVVDGRTVYDVEIERRFSVNPRVRVAEDGSILYDSRRRQAMDTSGEPVISPEGIPWNVPTTPKIRLEELPEAVKATVQAKAGDRKIADIEREMWAGRAVYEVEFAQPGLNPQIHVAEDGTLLRDERRPKGVAQWFKGTQVEDTPLPVQETIRREVGERRIVDIDKELRTGWPVYEVEVRDDEGSFTLHIAEDGRIVSDSRAPALPK